MAHLDFESEPTNDGPFDGLQLSLSGRWTRGGVLELRWADHEISLDLPLSTWSVLALLARKAIVNRADHWTRVFQTVEELTRGIHRETPLASPDPVRYVHRLRSLLVRKLKNWPPDNGSVDWKKLVDRHSTLGYGLPIPVANLEFIELDDESEPPSAGREC